MKIMSKNGGNVQYVTKMQEAFSHWWVDRSGTLWYCQHYIIKLIQNVHKLEECVQSPKREKV